MFRRQFKALIEMFQAQLSAIQEALANQERAIHDASGRQEEAWSRIEREFSEMRSGDEYKRGARTYRHKSYRQQVILNYLTGVAFLAAFAYVVITGLQLRQMRKSTKATQAAVEHADRNFQIDERAWIGFSFIPGNLTFTVGKAILRSHNAAQFWEDASQKCKWRDCSRHLSSWIADRFLLRSRPCALCDQCRHGIPKREIRGEF